MTTPENPSRRGITPLGGTGVGEWMRSVERRPRSLSALGVLVLALVVLAIGTVFALFNGVFTRYDSISVRLPATSTAALPGSRVQYRDVSIGKVVGDARSTGDGGAVVTVHIDPGRLQAVPASVRASVEPISVFGNEYVVLTPQDGGRTGQLRPGDTVPAADQGGASSLQQTVSSIFRLESALHPAELNAALTAVAHALQGQGTSLGQSFAISAAYLGQMQPLWGQAVQDLGLLAPVADSFTDATPDLTELLGNSTTTAGTISAAPGQLHDLLTGSASFSSQADQLNLGIERPFSLVAAASGPFLDAVASRPDSISQLLSGLDGFARAVTASGASGPYLTVSSTVPVQNVSNLATAALGGDPKDMIAQLKAGLGAGVVDPPTYTSSRLPQPGVGAAAAVLPASAQLVATVPPLPAGQQRDAVADITAALSGASPRSSDAASLLLSPLLASLGRQQ